jgi:hypothetical protein
MTEPEPVIKAGAVAALDDQPKSGEGSDSSARRVSTSPSGAEKKGRVVEDDSDPVERVARKTGWRPQSEWTRNPDKWVDAETWIERQQSEIKRLQDENRRAVQELAKRTEGQREAVRAEAEREVREAATNADPERALEASKRLASVSGPPLQVAAFVAENPWFNTVPEARALAQAVSARVKANGGSIDEELQSARDEVARRFPELFQDVSRPVDDRDSRDAQYGREGRVDSREEQSLADLARNSRPEVAGGSRSGGGRIPNKAKGFAQLPADTKTAFEKNFRHRGVDPEKYAQRYWADQG